MDTTTAETFLNGQVRLYAGDSSDVLETFADASIDSIVTDPPYALAFMGKRWDSGSTAHAVTFWAETFRVLKPGGHVVAFGGTRTYHRMVCAIEDAGFEVRDMLSWLYGSGFPKSHDVSKGMDNSAGAKRERILVPSKEGNRATRSSLATDMQSGFTDISQPLTLAAIEWQGWGTALKPACEPICLARKPLIGTVAANVLEHGTGAINIDGCRVGDDVTVTLRNGNSGGNGAYGRDERVFSRENPPGRWPANVIHDGSEEVIAAFPETVSGGAPIAGDRNSETTYGEFAKRSLTNPDRTIDGSAARFFYTAKADADDRLGSKHPTVKPVDLMQWLCRLVTPKGGTVLDPFAGTGTTGEAAFREGFNAVLIEREAEYQADIRRRMALVMAGSDQRAWQAMKAKMKDQPIDAGPLFAPRTS